jgi:hypothetical protein
MKAAMYDIVNQIGAFLDPDKAIAILVIKGEGQDTGKALFTVLLPETSVSMTDTQTRLFEAAKRNFYRGRTPKIARYRQAAQDTTVF